MSDERRLMGLLLVLTFATGVVDAVGYLGLDRVFTGNMTGNVIILGMGLAGADDLPVAGPLVALVGFLVGAGLVGRVVRDHPGWNRRSSVLLGVQGVVVAALATVLALDPTPPRERALVVTAVLAVAMGAQASTARAVAFRELTTVAVTSNIVGIAAHAWSGPAQRHLQVARGCAIVALVLGAAAGALLLRIDPGLALALAALLMIAVALVAATAGPRST